MTIPRDNRVNASFAKESDDMAVAGGRLAQPRIYSAGSVSESDIQIDEGRATGWHEYVVEEMRRNAEVEIGDGNKVSDGTRARKGFRDLISTMYASWQHMLLKHHAGDRTEFISREGCAKTATR